MSSNEKFENFNPPAIYSKVLTELLNVVVDYINDLAFSRISKIKKNYQFLPYDRDVKKIPLR